MMMLIIFLVMDILILLVMAFTPYVTRKTELFGVSLPAKERTDPELKKLCASFRNVSILVGAIFFVVQFLFAGFESDEMRQVFILTLGLIVFLGISFAIYLIYHVRMQRYKEAQTWRAYGRADAAAEGAGEPVLIADTSPAEKENPSALWLLLYLAIAVVTLIILIAVWPSLPEQIPIHADITGAIDGWVEKSSSNFATIIWPQWLLLGIFALTYWMIRISKRQIDAANPSSSRIQGMRFRSISSRLMIFLGAIISALVGVTIIAMIMGVSTGIVMLMPMLILAISIALVVFLFVFVGQGGSRLGAKEKATTNDKANDRASVDDDRYWKAGVFYVNRNDPSFIVEKRFGIGWTFNFAHPAGIAILAGIVAVIVFVTWFTSASMN